MSCIQNNVRCSQYAHGLSTSCHSDSKTLSSSTQAIPDKQSSGNQCKAYHQSPEHRPESLPYGLTSAQGCNSRHTACMIRILFVTHGHWYDLQISPQCRGGNNRHTACIIRLFLVIHYPRSLLKLCSDLSTRNINSMFDCVVWNTPCLPLTSSQIQNLGEYQFLVCTMTDTSVVLRFRGLFKSC